MEQTYTLVLEIDEAALGALRAVGARLMIAKQIGSTRPNVVWLTWRPLVRNTIVWNDTYGLFAAEVPNHNETAIRMLSLIYPAAERTTYQFTGDGFGERTASRIPRRHYDVRNLAPFTAMFGLLQDATVNGETQRSPVNAVVVPPEFTADFAAIANVYVWIQLKDSGGGGGGIDPCIPGDATLVVFDRNHPVKRYQYNDERGTFFGARQRSDGSFFRYVSRALTSVSYA